jgi:hypothetical protein
MSTQEAFALGAFVAVMVMQGIWLVPNHRHGWDELIEEERRHIEEWKAKHD